MYHQFKELADVDITTEPMEVGPTCHYMMGGVRVDPETQESTVPGLFAAGEVGGGMHGANRLGGNSLSDLLVFGKRAGEFAAEHAAEVPASPAGSTTTRSNAWPQESLAPFERPRGREPVRPARRAAAASCRATWASCGRKTDLETRSTSSPSCAQRAANVKCGGNIQFNPGWHLALDLTNMLDISEAVTRAALERSESRGAHTREDFPDAEPEWGKVNVIVRQTDGRDRRVARAAAARCRPS